MAWKLQAYFDERIPLVLRERDGNIYLQLQIDVARDDGLRAGPYYKKFYQVKSGSYEQVGEKVWEALNQYLEYSDLTLQQFEALTHMTKEEYDTTSFNNILEFCSAKDDKELTRDYISCSIGYSLVTKKYTFGLEWPIRRGADYYTDFADSAGKPNLITFDTPLEFYEGCPAGELGRMVMEALDRSRRIGDIVNRRKPARKTVELLDGAESTISVKIPKDRHFVDLEDNGVGELYQVYAYQTEVGQDPVAYFYIGMAAELCCNMEHDHIRQVWSEVYGKPEEMDIREVEFGRFHLRVEMRNKKTHRISYLTRLEEDLLLECGMEVEYPNRRKKTDARLAKMFEDFAGNCR